MSGSVFATKWQFLHATVLIGVDRTTGVFSGSEPAPGQQMVCVWTTDEIATDALHVESWDIRQITVRDLLVLLPEGIGVVVDPERPTGMTASASYIANLRRFIAPFPADAAIRLQPADALPPEPRAALNALIVAAVSNLDLVRELHAFGYTVDDSPVLGCVAHTVHGSPEDVAAVTRALETALATVDLSALGITAVHVMAFDDLPAEVAAAVAGRFRIHHRRRSRPWRR